MLILCRKEESSLTFALNWLIGVEAYHLEPSTRAGHARDNSPRAIFNAMFPVAVEFHDCDSYSSFIKDGMRGNFHGSSGALTVRLRKVVEATVKAQSRGTILIGTCHAGLSSTNVNPPGGAGPK